LAPQFGKQKVIRPGSQNSCCPSKEKELRIYQKILDQRNEHQRESLQATLETLQNNQLDDKKYDKSTKLVS